MAKKKMAKKKVAVWRSRAQQARRASHTSSRRKGRPKTRLLPGMETMAAIKSLDQIADAAADSMHRINADQLLLKGLKLKALTELRKHDRIVYKAHGIELVLVPGDEKVRARLISGEGAAEADGEVDDAVAGTGAQIEA